MRAPRRCGRSGSRCSPRSCEPETRETVAFLLEQGVEIVVLSGDAARTVGSIATDAGIPALEPPLDGEALPAGDADLDRLSASLSVVGRISPEGKRRVVESLRRNGRYVAMVGDGVNDVPALKASRLSIAQGSGAQMAKAVSDVVLVNGDFAAIPAMVSEGRRILRNIQRVTKLFVTKSVFAAFVIVAIGITPVDYPLLPRHLTLVGALTVGIPAFFLALAPSAGPWRTDDFLRDVGRFAVPAGVAAGLGVTTSYLIAVNVFDLGLLQSRTAATVDARRVGLYLVLALAPPPLLSPPPSLLLQSRGGDLDARRDRPLPRARARGDEHAARAARGPALRGPVGRLRRRAAPSRPAPVLRARDPELGLASAHHSRSRDRNRLPLAHRRPLRPAAKPARLTLPATMG